MRQAIEIGERVKRARIKARVSQEELGLLAETSRRPIYLLESGRGSVRLDTLQRILDALGLEILIVGKQPREEPAPPRRPRHQFRGWG